MANNQPSKGSVISRQVDFLSQRQGKTLKVSFPFADTPTSIHALVGFQDTDGNGDLEKGKCGTEEPRGFSLMSNG